MEQTARDFLEQIEDAVGKGATLRTRGKCQ
jgi:hypothetical protein